MEENEEALSPYLSPYLLPYLSPNLSPYQARAEKEGICAMFWLRPVVQQQNGRRRVAAFYRY
jgi:hypothetical protein